MEDKLILIEGDQATEMESYVDLLDHVIKQTFEIAVNSPEEYEDLDMETRAKLDTIHRIWL